MPLMLPASLLDSALRPRAQHVCLEIQNYQGITGKRIKWLILPLHESETDRHLIGLSG